MLNYKYWRILKYIFSCNGNAILAMPQHEASCIFLHNTKGKAYVKRLRIESGQEIFKTKYLNIASLLN